MCHRPPAQAAVQMSRIPESDRTMLPLSDKLYCYIGELALSHLQVL